MQPARREGPDEDGELVRRIGQMLTTKVHTPVWGLVLLFVGGMLAGSTVLAAIAAIFHAVELAVVIVLVGAVIVFAVGASRWRGHGR